jgi:hypothetical protein
MESNPLEHDQVVHNPMVNKQMKRTLLENIQMETNDVEVAKF